MLLQACVGASNSRCNWMIVTSFNEHEGEYRGERAGEAGGGMRMT